MPGKPIADPGMMCPLQRQDVSKVCHKCEWYIQLRGAHPQTGEAMDKWGCSIAFLPILMIENAQQSRQAGAAVESFRNEFVKAGEGVMHAIAQAPRMAQLR